MKKVFKDKILNVTEDIFDHKFLFEYSDMDFKNSDVEVFFMSELLEEKRNNKLFENLHGKYAMYSEVYSPKDELAIFEELIAYAVSKNKKIHIVGITLKEELEILEKYYTESGFMREDVNCFIPNFKNTLVTVSVCIENLMWRGSDYKAYKESIFFVPPIRESGQNKAIFKGINRGSILSIFIKNLGDNEKNFLEKCINEEKILPLTLGKVLSYNLLERGFEFKTKELIISYE